MSPGPSSSTTDMLFDWYQSKLSHICILYELLEQAHAGPLYKDSP